MTCLRPKNLTLNPVPSHSLKKKKIIIITTKKPIGKQSKTSKVIPKEKKKEEETLKLWEACQRLNGTFK